MKTSSAGADGFHLGRLWIVFGRLTIPSAVADRLIKSAVAERFVQPQRVNSLICCCLVQAVHTGFRNSSAVADGFEGQVGTFLSDDTIHFIRLLYI